MACGAPCGSSAHIADCLTYLNVHQLQIIVKRDASVLHIKFSVLYFAYAFSPVPERHRNRCHKGPAGTFSILRERYQLGQVENGADLCRMSLCHVMGLEPDTYIEPPVPERHRNRCHKGPAGTFSILRERIIVTVRSLCIAHGLYIAIRTPSGLNTAKVEMMRSYLAQIDTAYSQTRTSFDAGSESCPWLQCPADLSTWLHCLKNSGNKQYEPWRLSLL